MPPNPRLLLPRSHCCGASAAAGLPFVPDRRGGSAAEAQRQAASPGDSSETFPTLETSRTMTEPVFLLALAMAATTAVLVVRAIAGAISGRGPSRAALTQLTEQVEQHAAALDDAQNSLANQSTQLAELQERLDFAERLLAQGRDRPALRPGEKGG